MCARALLSIGCYCHFLSRQNNNMRTLAVGISSPCKEGSQLPCVILAARSLSHLMNYPPWEQNVKMFLVWQITCQWNDGHDVPRLWMDVGSNAAALVFIVRRAKQKTSTCVRVFFFCIFLLWNPILNSLWTGAAGLAHQCLSCHSKCCGTTFVSVFQQLCRPSPYHLC